MKTHDIIKESFKRGYRVTEDGKLLGLKGYLNISLYGEAKYPTFSVTTNLTQSGIYGIPVHQFAAYCFYGEETFNLNKVVRHLDGNVLNVSKTNIVLGTHSENNLDKPESVRIATAKKARAAQGYTPINAKLKEDARSEIIRLYHLGYSYSHLAALFNVCKSTIANLINGHTYNG